MKLEYRYGQVYYTDLHPGDIISMANNNYKVLTENDIDENGELKQNIMQLSSTLEFNKDKGE